MPIKDQNILGIIKHETIPIQGPWGDLACHRLGPLGAVVEWHNFKDLTGNVNKRNPRPAMCAVFQEQL